MSARKKLSKAKEVFVMVWNVVATRATGVIVGSKFAKDGGKAVGVPKKMMFLERCEQS